MNTENLERLLSYIDPSDYFVWLKVGMALKAEGYSLDIWNTWSRQSSKYQDGDCEEKWQTFNKSGVTMGSIYYFAKQGGWTPKDGEVIFSPLRNTNALDQFKRYITELHEDSDKVCIVREATYNEDRQKWHPKNGGISMSVKTLKEKLEYANTLNDVIGDYELKAGCWIRVNPMSEFGYSDNDVTSFKYALVESDDMSKAEQQSLMVDELKLPLAALVDSGGKSIHGIVKISAKDEFEYTERVNYLYRICRNHGLIIDENNKNPSRMSRLPGATRGAHMQNLIDINVGSSSWDEWVSYIHKRETGLPQMQSLIDIVLNPPELAEPLIDGLLRKGRKMLISGASKTGKSFSLIGLAYALAFGKSWMGFSCTECKVLYINLEIADDSFNTRMINVANALGIPRQTLAVNQNLKWLNMRGVNKSLNELSASIIDICKGEDFGAIILDPIYKVSFANENDAQEMARFCNSIDTICQELNTAMIYCHHHSKGSQSGKNAIDRMSGSGVLARDPDAIVDLLELEYTNDAKQWIQDKDMKETITRYLDTYASDWKDNMPDADFDDIEFLEECTKYRLNEETKSKMRAELMQKLESAEHITPIRLSASVREFPPMNPRAVYFKHPLHYADTDEIFIDAKPLDQALNIKAEEKKRNTDKMKSLILQKRVPMDSDGWIDLQDMAAILNVSPKTIHRYIKQAPETYELQKGRNGKQKPKFKIKNMVL